MISNLRNPTMAVFFASLPPQFAPVGGATVSALRALGLVFATVIFAWLALYAVVIARVGDLLNRSAIRRAIEGVTGMLLIGLGLRIATEQM